MITLLTQYRRPLAITTGAEAATEVVARAAFLLFVFLCVATSPGVGQFLVGAVGPITEEHLNLREHLAPGAATRLEPSRETAARHESIPANRDPRSAPPRILAAAVTGHRLANGLCAPLRL
jgi:hypothetical protein